MKCETPDCTGGRYGLFRSNPKGQTPARWKCAKCIRLSGVKPDPIVIEIVDAINRGKE